MLAGSNLEKNEKIEIFEKFSVDMVLWTHRICGRYLYNTYSSDKMGTTIYIGQHFIATNSAMSQ